MTDEQNPNLLGVAAAVGALWGRLIVASSGMTAAGMVGGGAGVGAPAGPVGAAGGALVGMAAYGVFRVIRDCQRKAEYYAYLNAQQEQEEQ